MSMWKTHPDENVQQAMIRLCDALCSWERSTGRQNLLVVIEQDEHDPLGRYEFVADCGKPLGETARAGMTPEEFVKTHCEHYASEGQGW